MGKRIRALRVHDFPFFRQHKPARGTITMENGDMAAVCLDCFENLKNQFVEAANYGIPLEKRQYNWMVIPPPPEDSSQLITPKERLDKHIFSIKYFDAIYCYFLSSLSSCFCYPLHALHVLLSNQLWNK